MKGYPLDALYEEIAFLGYYLHWDYLTLMGLDHRERRRWCEEISRINREVGGIGTRERSLVDL
ncbi:DUF6760 family protein [Sorangium sp. So ce726]|uniref:DUF6760 family protein n=1 Tax=Sorangium sp. So ce726 TaxID=3133319 RepID=UPI003F60CC76